MRVTTWLAAVVAGAVQVVFQGASSAAALVTSPLNVPTAGTAVHRCEATGTYSNPRTWLGDSIGLPSKDDSLVLDRCLDADRRVGTGGP